MDAPVPKSHTQMMGAMSGVRQDRPGRREQFLDERETVLRATWHPERGFVNLSVWRGNVCADTFHLPAAEVPRLIGLLADGMAGPTTTHLDPDLSMLRSVPDLRIVDGSEAPRSWVSRAGSMVRGIRRRSGDRVAR